MLHPALIGWEVHFCFQSCLLNWSVEGACSVGMQGDAASTLSKHAAVQCYEHVRTCYFLGVPVPTGSLAIEYKSTGGAALLHRTLQFHCLFS
jgi:hypothetical protein